MKKITSFLATLLIAVAAMAQSEITFTVSPEDGGTYKNASGSPVTQGWCASWTSTSENYPVTKISVPVNNLYVKTSDGFQMAVGQSSPSNWTLSVQGYEIKSYSFKFKSTNNNQDVTLTAGSKTMTSSYSTEQTWSVEDVNAQTASFQLSGGNNPITVTDLTFTVSASSAIENGKVYRLVCAGTPSVALGVTAFTDVAAVSANAGDRSQQWYVTIDGNNYTFRNLANGRYLQGNNGTSGAWSLTGTITNFTVTTVNDNYVIRQTGHSNSYAYMHKDGSNNIVSWEANSENSQWQFMAVSYTADELQAIWDEIETFVVPEATVEIYNTTLEAIFADKACTQLNSTYAAKTVEQIKVDANYLALPAVLRAMVLKVKGGDWGEENAVDGKDGWSSDYAKRFRVQMYEPYSIEGEVTSYLRINAHCNMDNPTGIYANAGEAIYVMVDGDIADGAELWIAHQTGFGANQYYNNSAYFQLKKGLNVIPYFNDGSTLWINYVVHTYNGNGATIADKFPENRKLSNYKPLKIHIEGGYINGFFNAIGDFRATDSGTEDLWGAVDNDDDWNYYKERAPLNGTDAPNRDFPLLGHRQTLLFPLGQQANDEGGMEKGLLYHLDNITVLSTPNCYGGNGTGFGNYSDTYYPGMGLSASNGKINIMIEAWDRIMYSELASLGVVSKSVMDRMNTLYPRWTSEGTPAEIYNYGSATVNGVTQTYQEFCQGIDYSEYFNHHGCGVGANSGYMSGGWRVCNYHYNTMGSIIGAIANEAGPTWGPAHEIGHQHQTVFNLNGQTEVTNNFFSNVAVWYMGMGTSRVNGNEGSLESVLGAFNSDGNDLYTNNIWAITHLYYRLWLYYHLAGNNTQFWPRLFELCRQEPLVNGGQISGETSLLRFYKHACNAAGEDLTEFFRAHGYFEIMDNRLVGDYSNATYNVTQSQIDAAISEIKAKKYPVNYAVLLINDGTAETTLKHDGATRRALWDGSATAEFGSVNDFIDGDIAALTGYTATVDAEGNVTMSGGEGGAGFLVFNENGELVSFSNKSNFTLSEEAMYQLVTGKTNIVAVDAENNTVEAEVDMAPMQKSLLTTLIADVEAMPIDDGTYTHIGFYTKASAGELLAALESAKEILEADNGGYAAAYEILYAQKKNFVENTDKATFVPFDPALTYIITNYAYGNTMYVNSGVKVSSSADKSANTAKWQFKTTSTDGVYNIYSLSGYYLPAASKSAGLQIVSEQASAATYVLEATDKVGAWAISVTPAGEFKSLHDNSYGTVVGWSNDVEASMWYLTAVEGSNNSNASSSADELQALIAKTETLVEEVASVSYKGKIDLQTTDAASAYYITSNATEGGHEPKYLLDNNVTTFFHTVWTGTSPGADHYLQIDMGENTPIDQFVFKYTNLPTTSNNVDAAETIVVSGSNNNSEFTLITTLTGLPTAKEGTYTSATLGAKGTNYRYIRLTVTDATGGKHDNRYYFGMSEFSLERVNNYSVVKNYYTTVNSTTVETAADKLIDAKTVLANGGDFTAHKKALQDAYDALCTEYNSLTDSKKNDLQAAIDAITAKMDEAGAVNIVKGGEVALQVADASAPYYLSTNSQESGSNRNISTLLDGVTNNSNVYFHTNWQTSVGTYHHLLLDMGTDNSLGEFAFEYTTRNNNAGIDAPRTIVVEGSDDNSSFTQIAELTGLPTGQHATYTSATLGNNATPYRYIRFRVTEGAGNVGGYAYFAMSEFDVTAIGGTAVTINDAYLNTAVTNELLLATYYQIVDAETLKNNAATTEQIDAQIAKLQAAQETLEDAMSTILGINKEELQSLYDAAVALYSKMTGGELDYTPSALTPELLAEAKTTIDAAKAQLDAQTTTQGAIDAAKDALQEKYDALYAIEEANVASRDELAELIANVKTLLGTIAAEGDYKAAISLQASNEANDFYIKLSAVGDGNVANMLDKNADGSANIDTYVGSAWGSGLADYTHYVQIDLGAVYSINTLLFDYTTRNSGHDTERPTAIKVLGSNDGTDYTEIAIIEEGLAAGAGEQWTMEEPLALGADYRYIRLAVKSGVNSFHMSDFNIYAMVPYTLDEYYDTADGLNFNTLCFALQQAEKLAGRYLVEAQYTAICEKLTACYTAAQGVVDAGYAGERESIATLIAETKTLLATIATADEEQTPVAYTLNEYYTTAQGLGFDALCLALQQAEAISGKYVTAEQYPTIYSALESAYTTASGIVNDDYTAREALATLITNANLLITEIATEVESPELSTANVYCNADNSTNSGAGSGDKQGVAALFDGDVSTHLHTTYGNNRQDDDLDHYIRVDLGEASAFSAFRFSYKGREANNNNAPTDMLVQVCNTLDGEWVTIKTLTGLPSSGASPVSYESDLIEMGGVYRYVRFMVTDTQNHSTTTYNEVSHKFFVMSEFRLEARTSVVVKDEYSTIDSALARDLYNKKNVAADATAHYMTESEYNATLAGLQASYDNIVAPLKETLQAQVEPLQALYDKMATDNGDVEAYYSSVLAADVLAAAGEALSVAQGLLADDATVTVTAIVEAKSELEAQYNILKGIDDADVNIADRGELTELIATMQSLLGETTSSITTGAVALQATNAENDFYIWCNAPAGDSNGVAGLIDKNGDGSANTGTFLGTVWGATVAAYTHYLEIDLGASAIEDLLIDYTTRDSESYGNQRPNGLKISGSNDKETYEEIVTITEGLPTGRCEKWTMPAPVALTTGYRYIRIAVSTEVGFFNMSDFNLYSNSIATVNENYSTSDIFACLPAVLGAYSVAQAAASAYVTETDYEAAKTALQEQIEALNAIKDANVTDKSELTDLIAATNELIAEVADIDETETVLALQTTDANALYYIYCNAPGESNNYSGDNLGVAALLDVDENGEPITATFLHSTYHGDSHDDELDHYLRVDMGESNLVSFKFRYTPRIGNTSNAPLVMLIEGSNDCVNFEEITTLTDMSTTYESAEITNGKAYRYIRFMVKETHNNAKFNGHPYFAMSHFEMTACKTIVVKEEYSSPNLPLAKVTAANNEAVEAGVIESQFYVTQQAYETALASLQAAKFALEVAKASKDMPVLITTDVNNPILYKIKINREGDKRLKYDEASSMVAVADVALNAYQAWYFMLGDNSATNDLLILPYKGEGKVLATNSFSEGNSKVKLVEKGTEGYSYNWNIVAIENSEWSNITIPNGSGTTFYFSNHGGPSNKMGFYNNSGDGGSQFKFILDDTDYSLPEYYYTLYNQHLVCGGEKTEGNRIGQYKETTDYNAAYSAAATMLENRTATNEEYEAAYNTLKAAYEALELNVPQSGAFYHIRSAYTGQYSDGKKVYVDAENKPYFAELADESQPNYVWQFEKVNGGYNLKNLQTQTYVTAASGHVTMGETGAKLITIDVLDANNAIVRLNVSGGSPLHAQASGSKLVGWNGGLNSASAWYIDEVENPEQSICYTVASLSTGAQDDKAYSSLYLGFPTVVPDGVTAYIVNAVDGDDKLRMVEITDGIIPANVGVILSSEEAMTDQKFYYSSISSTTDVEDNMLTGTTYTKLVDCRNQDIYMLAKKNNRIALYWTYENRDENGNKLTIDGTTNHNQGGYVQCNANKAYMVANQGSQANIAMYSFFYGGTTTEINDVTDEAIDNSEIFDLQGRKLNEKTKPGIYIVNGKKVIVSNVK